MYLIIYAHPETRGYCSKILDTVKNTLYRRGKRYQVLDLYKMNYNPLLMRNEHYTAGNRDVDSVNQKIQKKMRQAEGLIFIYPVWWGSMPAVLKGFFDRVFTPRFAFRYKGIRPIGLLKNKALVLMTAGSPLLLFKTTGNRPKILIKHDILGLSGVRAKVVQFTGCRALQDKKLAKVRKKANKETLAFIAKTS